MHLTCSSGFFLFNIEMIHQNNLFKKSKWIYRKAFQTYVNRNIELQAVVIFCNCVILFSLFGLSVAETASLNDSPVFKIKKI